MTRFLLDINGFIALIDPAHVQHDKAHLWFAAKGHKAWSTCPLTENGALRIVGHPRYRNRPGSRAAVAELLISFWKLPDTPFGRTLFLCSSGNTLTAHAFSTPLTSRTATFWHSLVRITVNSPPSIGTCDGRGALHLIG